MLLFPPRRNYLLGNKIFPEAMKHTSPLTLDRVTHSRSKCGYTKVQLCEPMDFMVSGTFRNSHDSTRASPKPTPAWAHKSWEPGAHCTACRQPNRLETGLFRYLSWSKFLLRGSSCLRIFCVAFLLFFLAAGLCFLIRNRGREAGRELLDLVNFREFWKLVVLLLLLLLGGGGGCYLPARGVQLQDRMFSSQRRRPQHHLIFPWTQVGWRNSIAVRQSGG